jgi:hypothetical protein
MALPYLAATKGGQEAGADEWKTILDFGVLNWINIINNGDVAGEWRLVDNTGQATEPAHLPAGAGESGQRRSAFTITCPSFSGKLQIKAANIGERLSNVHAFGMK